MTFFDTNPWPLLGGSILLMLAVFLDWPDFAKVVGIIVLLLLVLWTVLGPAREERW